MYTPSLNNKYYLFYIYTGHVMKEALQKLSNQNS